MGTPQIISTTVNGPIFSNGAEIVVTSTGAVDGEPTGIAATTYNINVLSNSGTITGGSTVYSGAAGVGVLNRETIDALINTGSISGAPRPFGYQNGGVAVSNFGTIVTLDNLGGIAGGNGATGGAEFPGGQGGVGFANQGAITNFLNAGQIVGGNGGTALSGGGGGSGLANQGAITRLTNTGSISGGVGAVALSPAMAAQA